MTPPRRLPSRSTGSSRLGRILHFHGEPFAQYRQGCLDLLGFGFVRGIEHAAHDAFIDVQTPRQLGIVDAVVPHREIEGQLGSEPSRDRDQVLAAFGGRWRGDFFAPRKANGKIGT